METPQELGLPAKFNEWRHGQGDIIEEIALSDSKHFLLDAPTGCHAKGQMILMHNGTTKKVEDVMVGDLLMGSDSEPREVNYLCRGFGDMVDIVPIKGEPFRVNLNHILSLKITNGVYKPNLRPQGRTQYSEGSHKGAGIYGGLTAGQIIDMPVSEYIKKSDWFKSIAKLYRAPANFKGESALPIAPYFLGILLGDGGIKGTINVTSTFEIPEMYVEADRFHVRVMLNGNRGKAKTWNLTIPRSGNRKNPLREALKGIGLLGTGAATKFIPLCYKSASFYDRLEILAGLMDTDGSVARSGFEYSSKSQLLAKDVVFIARSVGLAAYVSPCQKACQTGAVGTYYRVFISGNCSIIPTRHRIAQKRKQIKDWLVTGFKIKTVRSEHFYGFNLSGNGRFLLGDFTVTHNSGKSLVAIGTYKKMVTAWRVMDRMLNREEKKHRCIYVTRTIQLQNQILSEFPEARTLKGRNNYRCLMHPDKFPEFTAEHCPGSKKCGYSDTCPYLVDKAAALKAPIAVLNEAYYLAEINGPGQFSDAEFVILDEVDSLESTLLGFISLTVTAKQMARLGLEPPEETGRIGAWRQWADVSIRRLDLSVRNAQLTLGDVVDEWGAQEMELQKTTKRVESFSNKLSQFVTCVNDNWILTEENLKDDWKWTFRPVLIGDYAEKALWQHAIRYLGMSGTIFDQGKQLAHDVGLEMFDYKMIPSPFLVEHRPIYYESRPDGSPATLCNITYQTRDRELPVLAAEVAKIVDKYPDSKVLIHTVSYAIQSYLLTHLPMLMAGVGDRLTSHGSDNREEMLRYFKTSAKPLVMLSPSFDRGVDLTEDVNCHCVIICKVPYLDLSDKQTKARMAMPDGNKWYALRALQTIVQMSGRAVRSADQCCDTYILDRNFGRLKFQMRSVIPHWWLEAIH